MRHRLSLTPSMVPAAPVELSIVIPVYNASAMIGELVAQLLRVLANLNFEIVLVNDGSNDESEQVCADLAEQHPDRVMLLQLTRNFGEHNAVMAGLRHAGGDYVAIIDDDGQNSVGDLCRMFLHAKENNFDVVYSRYRRRHHPWLRILGSGLNDRVANVLLKKPRELYLSSFKVINRAVVDEIIRYAGPFPYVDGLILRVTRNIGQLDATHLPRRQGRSGYTLAKLAGLWLNMSVGFSLAPLRVSLFAGLFTIAGALLMAAGIAARWIWFDPRAALALPCLVAAIVGAIGVQLVMLGIVGEYVGRIFLHQSGMPQNVVRYVRTGQAEPGAQPARQNPAGAVTG